MLPPAACTAIIGSAVYYHRSLAIAIPIAALLALALVFFARRLSRLRFSQAGIEGAGQPFIPWSKIVKIELLDRQRRIARRLYLDTGEIIYLDVVLVWWLPAVDRVLREHVTQAASVPRE